MSGSKEPSRPLRRSGGVLKEALDQKRSNNYSEESSSSVAGSNFLKDFHKSPKSMGSEEILQTTNDRRSNNSSEESFFSFVEPIELEAPFRKLRPMRGENNLHALYKNSSSSSEHSSAQSSSSSADPYFHEVFPKPLRLMGSEEALRGLYHNISNKSSEESFSRTVKPRLFDEFPVAPMPIFTEEIFRREERLNKKKTSSQQSFSRTVSAKLADYFPVLSLEPTIPEEAEGEVKYRRTRKQISQESFTKTLRSTLSVESFSDEQYHVRMPPIPEEQAEDPSRPNSSRGSVESFSRTVKPVPLEEELATTNARVRVPNVRLLPLRNVDVDPSSEAYRTFQTFLPDIYRLLIQWDIDFRPNGVYLTERHLPGQRTRDPDGWTIVVEAIYCMDTYASWLKGLEEIRNLLTVNGVLNKYSLELVYRQGGDLRVIRAMEACSALKSVWPFFEPKIFHILGLYSKLRTAWRRIDIRRREAVEVGSTMSVMVYFIMEDGFPLSLCRPAHSLISRLFRNEGYADVKVQFIEEREFARLEGEVVYIGELDDHLDSDTAPMQIDEVLYRS